MGAAGVAKPNDMLELFAKVHVDVTTNEIIIPVDNLLTGCYVVVSYPLTTRQDAIDEDTYIFKAGEFVIYKDSNPTLFNGVCTLFTKIGVSDYWGINTAYVDPNTKTEISIKCGNGKTYFKGNRDIYVFRVKGD